MGAWCLEPDVWLLTGVSMHFVGSLAGRRRSGTQGHHQLQVGASDGGTGLKMWRSLERGTVSFSVTPPAGCTPCLRAGLLAWGVYRITVHAVMAFLDGALRLAAHPEGPHRKGQPWRSTGGTRWGREGSRGGMPAASVKAPLAPLCTLCLAPGWLGSNDPTTALACLSIGIRHGFTVANLAAVDCSLVNLLSR